MKPVIKISHRVVVENHTNSTARDALTVYDPDSDLAKLEDVEIVKVRFAPRITIADYSFKEFKSAK